MESGVNYMAAYRTNRQRNVSPVYVPGNSYIDSPAYVEGYPNSATNPQPGPGPSDNKVGSAKVGSAKVG